MSDRQKKGRPKRDRTERVLIGIAILLSLFFGVGLFFSVKLLTGDETRVPRPQTSEPPGDAIAMSEDQLPDHLAVGQRPPEASFRTEDGGIVPLSGLCEGQSGAWLVFWASWCPDCAEQFQYISDMKALAERYDVALVLVDRLDPNRESVDAVREKLDALNADVSNVYDDGQVCYRAWGMHEIPSSIVMDRDGVVREYRAGVLTPGECEGMLQRARDGRFSVGLAFINRWLTDGDGGVHVNDDKRGKPPSGTDVLSESQGLMMAAALTRNDRALFDLCWQYARAHLWRDGLFAWYAGGENSGEVNALLDDLRIWRALRDAAARWGGDYAERAAEVREAVAARCVNAGGGLVDYAAFADGAQADGIALCYLDLDTLALMAAEDERFQAPLAKAGEILENGRISDAFPLYYSRYVYRTGAYSGDDLNAAEALFTLWHLSRAGRLPQDASNWLRQQVAAGTLYARYRTDGTPVPGYAYHSTAVYGIAALIAREIGDDAMLETAIRRMERKCVTDAGDELFGAYMQKGETVHAFDQLIPLTVNAFVDERTVS